MKDPPFPKKNVKNDAKTLLDVKKSMKCLKIPVNIVLGVPIMYSNTQGNIENVHFILFLNQCRN